MPGKKPIIISLILITLLSIPLTIYIISKEQETRSRAEKSATLSFTPGNTTEESPLESVVDNTLSTDIILTPGTNLVSEIKLELLYDQTKFQTLDPGYLKINADAFPQIIEGPNSTPGKIMITISIGQDPSKAIQSQTKVGTLNLKAINPTTSDETPTSITFGNNTQIIALSTDSTPTENILSSTQPVVVAINQSPLPACSARPACLDQTPKCQIEEPVGGWCNIPPPTIIPKPTSAKCPDAPTDSILVIDKSGSMNDRNQNKKSSKIKSAKDAAKNFIEILSLNAQNKIGLVTFNNRSKLENPLTQDYNKIKNLISSISAKGYTCHECAINSVNQEFASNNRPNTKKVAILLTDGKANWIEGNRKRVNQSKAEQKAMEAIKNTSIPANITFYTIGLGNDVNSNFLKQIADETGGKYFFSPTSDDLQGIYQEISEVLAKGSVNGFVFSDLNNNGVFDQNETKLPGWTISITSTSDNSTQSIVSDQSGTFNITNLCDGSYKINQTLQPGWTQTIPTNPSEYNINITGGNAFADIIFGNFKALPTPTPTPTNTPTPTPSPTSTPTPTLTPSPTPQGTTVLINGLLDGIGSRGDNSNPDGAQSNKDPLHPVRNLTIEIFNAANQLVAEISNSMQYDSNSGKFIGKLTLPQSITTGNYIIKASTDNHLTRLLPGIQIITQNQQNSLTDAIFVAGDIVYDNQLNIKDYNSLVDCYSDLAPPTSCDDAQKKDASDLNDDGNVNQFDYNLFLREIATQPGQ